MTRVDLYTKVILTIIAALLGILAFRPVAHPGTTVLAQADGAGVYIEPGTNTLRKPDGTEQVQGKVVIDRNGDAWGFPTMLGAPYPVDTTNTKPPTSEPMYLGRFDFAKIQK